MASSTKNIKGDRKVVRVTIKPTEFYFKIPDGLDLEDKTVVEDWEYRNRRMYITYVGKKEVEEIEAFYKYEVSSDCEQDTEIIDADDADNLHCDYYDEEDED